MSTHEPHPLLSHQPLPKKGKLVCVEDAVRLIHDGDTVATGGFLGIGFAEGIAVALEQYFLTTGRPRHLTLFFVAGPGDGGERGLNHLAHEGLVNRVIGGFWGLTPKLGKLALENKIQAYNLPAGVLSHLLRDTAAHKPGTLTPVGLGTFVDPRFGGGKVNAITTKEIVERVTIQGQDYLFYRTHPINVAILRGTTADTDGNISLEKEALFLESLAIALATHNSGGIVIVQVERIIDRNLLPAKNVKIPGVLVDCIVVAEPEHHWQTFAERYHPAFSGEIRAPMQFISPMALDECKLIARRAAFELKPNSIVTLGIGIPEGIVSVAHEEKILEFLTFTAGPGTIGGMLVGGLNFGAAANAQAIIDMPSQFDFYDGGGLDAAFLGMAQVDRTGNVNGSKFGSKLTGAGGIINISHNTKELIFAGTFTAGGLKVTVENGQLCLLQEGKLSKFIQDVEQCTFNGSYAIAKGQRVLYVTERCVFRLTAENVELIEIAPGVDLEKNILAKMAFRPKISEPLPRMDARIFRPEAMNLKKELLKIPSC